MKYVRTKDGIYKAVLFSPLGFIRIDKRNGTFPDVFRKDILKQADTIEELCDEFVRVHKTFNNMSMVCDKELAISSSKYPKHYDVYGSIWVDGELHKVAKMNKEGELELL